MTNFVDKQNEITFKYFQISDSLLTDSGRDDCLNEISHETLLRRRPLNQMFIL